MRLWGDPAPASGTLPPVRYELIGGHSAGRVVELDDPAPPFLSVAYRVPADLPLVLANPGEITLGIERYDLHYHEVRHGPPVPVYICPDLPK